jgi:hypothetical protein
LEFSLFSQKYSVQKSLISKVRILGIRQIIIQRQIRQKYFVENGRRQEWTRDYFWIFLDTFWEPSKNVHFALCAPSILKHEIQNTKKRGCDHYALKTHFWP